MKHNDIDLENWKDSDINTDSLWLIKERDKSSKHKTIILFSNTNIFLFSTFITL